MNRKATALVLVGFILCVGAILSLLFFKHNMEKGVLDYKIMYGGYSDLSNRIITSYDEYTKLMLYAEEENRKYGEHITFDFSIYDQEFFKDKSLALINIVIGTGMNKLRKIDVYTKDNKLYYNADIDYAEGNVTMDITGVVILVEVDKNIRTFG